MTPKILLRGLPPIALGMLYPAALVSPLAIAALSDLPPISPWLEAGAATGLVAAVGLAVQFITSGRFETLSGRVGIDVTMAFHKWSARSVLLIVFLHPLAFGFPMALQDPGGALMRVATMFTMPNLFTGVVALAALGLLIVLAIARDRLHYEAWRGFHAILALTIVGLVVHHSWNAGTYSSLLQLRVFWILLGVLIILNVVFIYVVRTRKLRRNPWHVESVRNVARRLWEVALKPVNNYPLNYHAGQFVWLTVQPRLFPLFDHPFSIASSPQMGSDLRLIIKESGDFTSKIGQIKPGTVVGIDGPHGSFVLADQRAETLLLVAGGVGIAPILGLLRDLAAAREQRPVCLVYASKEPSDMINPEEIKRGGPALDVTWFFVVEQATDEWPYRLGMIDKGLLKDALGKSNPKRAAAMVCGPGSMITNVTNMLNDLGVPLKAIHYEKFDYGDGERSRRDRRLNFAYWLMGGLVIAAIAAFSLR